MFHSVPFVKALCGRHHVCESTIFLLVVPLRQVLAVTPDLWRRPSNRRLSRHSGICPERVLVPLTLPVLDCLCLEKIQRKVDAKTV